MTYTMGSLFAGIGGFDLGFERAGFKTSWQVEIDPYCQKVLAKNFPEAERFGDIRECGRHNLKPVDVICGGFPCQDISNAGKRAGIEGERSGLWSEYARIIRELRPRYVVVENVAALLGRGMGRVLGDLAEIGYDAEWEIISAADVGAPHLRERVWVLAYPMQRGGCSEPWQQQAEWSAFVDSGSAGDVAHAGYWREGWQAGEWPPERQELTGDGKDVADSQSEQDRRLQQPEFLSNVGASCEMADPDLAGLEGAEFQQQRNQFSPRASNSGWWAVEPNVGRVGHGIPKRVDRLRGLGNAVVPQIPEAIAERIREALERNP